MHSLYILQTVCDKTVFNYIWVSLWHLKGCPLEELQAFWDIIQTINHNLNIDNYSAVFTTVHKGVSDESRIIILSLNLEDKNRYRHPTVNVSNSFCIDIGYTVCLHTKYLPIKLSWDTVSDMFICRKVIRTKEQCGSADE